MTASPRKRAAAKAAPTRKGNTVSDDTKQPDPEPTPPEQPDEDAAPAGLQLGDLQHCPTPGLCFPYGLSADTSHAACEHGETHANS
jgi:hypothetical protein